LWKARRNFTGGASDAAALTRLSTVSTKCEASMPQSTTLNRTIDQIRQALERRVASGFAAGIVALVGQGEAREVAAAGAQALGGPPMRPDTLFRIASMTKPVTAAAALMLIDDGKLALDEPVDRLLPELAHRRVLRRLDGPLDDTVPASRPITVEDLLTFRLGIGVLFGSPADYPILAATQERKLAGFGPPLPDEDYGPDEWMRRLGELPLMAQPGERWLYTTGSNVLGVLIARASGLTFPDFLHRRIFEPLGMADTAFFAPREKQARLAESYRPTPNGLERYSTSPTAWRSPPNFPAGDAGLVSTAPDFFAFSRFLLRGGLTVDGRRLLSQASIQAMTRDHLSDEQRTGGRPILAPGQGWGYGVGVTNRRTSEGVPPGAYGWMGGLGTSWIADPTTDRTVLVLTQTAFTGPEDFAAHAEVWRAVYA
jgi:CubicO group peptidase (beta-lactamase class C family)